MKSFSTWTFAMTIVGLVNSSPLTLSSWSKVFTCEKASHQRSCHLSNPPSWNSSATCCYNGAIGPNQKQSGLFLSTQFWTTDSPSDNNGPFHHNTVHGLWPDNCDGSYYSFCSNVTGIPEYTGSQIRSILDQYDPSLLEFMDQYYLDYKSTENDIFWEHEWNKHATCITTLPTECQPSTSSFSGISQTDYAVLQYYQQIVRRFKKLPTFQWLKQAGIVPSFETDYSLEEIQNVLTNHHDGNLPFIGCNRRGELNEFWYYYTVKGSIGSGQFFAEPSTTVSTCPSVVRYLPKP